MTMILTDGQQMIQREPVNIGQGMDVWQENRNHMGVMCYHTVS